MKASTTTLVAVLTMGMLGLVASDASAGGFSVSFGHGHHGHHKNHGHHKYHGYYGHHRKVYVKKVYVAPAYDRCYRPHYSTCYVLPTDTYYTLSQRIYGHRGMWKHIASYNGLSFGAPLPIGQQLRMPVINANGTLAVSTAGVAPANFGQPQIGQQFSQPQVPQMNAAATPNAIPTQQPAAQAQPATPAVKIRIATPAESFPSVAMGSIVMLDGQQLGNTPGTVRMRINGLALPVKVLDWNANTAKIQLPQLDLAKVIQAELEVTRADGSLASKSTINLTPAATRLALGN